VLVRRFYGLSGVAVDILWDVWCCSGDSMGFLVVLWGFCRVFTLPIGIF
jgi:hypothetical protein